MNGKEPRHSRFKYRGKGKNIRFKVEENNSERDISELSQPTSKRKTGAFGRNVRVLSEKKKGLKNPPQEILNSKGNKESTASILLNFTKSITESNTPKAASERDNKNFGSDSVVSMRLKKKKAGAILKVKEVKGEDEDYVVLPEIRKSNVDIQVQEGWTNIRRVLIFATRGISPRDRHLMNDLRRLLPHSRTESKLERQPNLQVVNDICASRHCGKCILFEGRCLAFSYVWLSNVSGGPSAKFLLQNTHTMDELRFTGNCLLGSRPLLSFDEKFDKFPHYRVIKELLVQTFGVSHKHPKSQPFFDRVFLFSVVDRRIWFRNFQILSEEGGITEIGPRFVLNPVKIFSGSFGGDTLWQNPKFQTPVKLRQLVKKSQSGFYVGQQNQKRWDLRTRDLVSYPVSEDIFTASPLEKAKEIVSERSNATTKKGNQEHKNVENKQWKVDAVDLSDGKLKSLKRKRTRLNGEVKKKLRVKTNMAKKIKKKPKLVRKGLEKED